MKTNFNTNLIKIFDNEPRISHRVIAKEVFEFDQNKNKTEQEQLKNKMTQIKELITDNIDDFEEFGHLRIETESVKNSVGAINQEKTYFINEQQATLLLTFMRNTPKIKNFKKQLVKVFFEMRQLLLTSEKQTSHDFDLDSYISKNEKMLKLIELITSKNAITLHYLDKLTRSLNIKSPLDLLKIDLNSYYFIPTELGKFFNKSAVEINKMLEHKGFQFKENGEWFLTEKGQNFGFKFQNGSFKTIKWKLESLI